MNEITLYAKDNEGNILSWNCYIINRNTTCSLIVSYGRLDGGKVTTEEPNIVGKQGRTHYEQAQSRLVSRANLKKKRGYIELTRLQSDIVEVNNIETKIQLLDEILPKYRQDSEGLAKPMKAAQYYRKKANWVDPSGKMWKERKHYYFLNPYEEKEEGAIVAKFPMMLQPKINGVRAFLYLNKEGKATLRSKDGLIYKAPSHITDWANANKDIFLEENPIELDGELYIHGESLQTIQSAVKAINFNTNRVRFILFDLAVKEFTNEERWDYIFNEIRLPLDCPIERIRTEIVTSDKQAQRYCDEFIAQGYEGIILRDLKAYYGFGSRRNNMLKLKRTISEDFTIIKILPQPKRPDLALFLCFHKGKGFKINPTFSDEKKAFIMNHPILYLGKKLQTTFYEWTDAEKPFHIIDTVIRDYE